MAIIGAAGTTLGASASLAATKDDTGVNALTFTTVGKTGTMPDLDGSFDVATFDGLGEQLEYKEVDIFRAGSGTLEVALDDDDAGQGILETAALTGAIVGLQATLNNGNKYYREAIIKSFMPTGLTVGGIVRATVDCDYTGRTVKIDA